MWSHPFLLGKEGRKVRSEGTEGSRPIRAVWGAGSREGGGQESFGGQDEKVGWEGAGSGRCLAG